MKIICEKEVELQGERYIVYLKEVATKIAAGGEVEKKTTKAFVRKA